MASPTLQFSLFPRLPVELRKEIWRFCLPHRVWEITQPADDIVFAEYDDTPAPYPCMLRHTTYMNGRPPVISRVCHEARSVAFEAGSILLGRPILPDRPADRPPEAQWKSSIDVVDAWRDSARDSAHTNWASAYEAEYDYFGNPVYSTAWEALRLPGGGSFTLDYFHRRFGSEYEFVPGVGMSAVMPVSHDKTKDDQALGMLSTWLVVMRVIVVHLDFRSAAESGLFGLLGDAWVQVIDAADQSRIDTFLEYAEVCEQRAVVTTKQDFVLEPPHAMRRGLRELVLAEFHSENLVALMRPAVMFRLCTRMCNHQSAPGHVS